MDCEKRMETPVLNIFQKSFPQYFGEAGFHISLSVILDRKFGLYDTTFALF